MTGDYNALKANRLYAQNYVKKVWYGTMKYTIQLLLFEHTVQQIISRKTREHESEIARNSMEHERESGKAAQSDDDVDRKVKHNFIDESIKAKIFTSDELLYESMTLLSAVIELET